MTESEIEALLHAAGLSGITLGKLRGTKAIFIPFDKEGKREEFVIGSVAFKPGNLILNHKDGLRFILVFRQDKNEWSLVKLSDREEFPGAVILPYA